MFDDNAMYDDARIAKLKQLKSLMMELELEGMDGEISPEKLEAALAEADVGAAEMTEEAPSVEPSLEEEDPLAAKRKAFFKPEPPKPRPGSAQVFGPPSVTPPKVPGFPDLKGRGNEKEKDWKKDKKK